MPLTRDNVTASLRVLLPNTPLILCWIGIGWLFDAPGQLNGSAALKYADHIAPIQTWGLFLIALGAAVAAALATHNRTACRVALLAAALTMLVFVVVFGLASIRGGATISAPAWPYLGLVVFVAADRSLLKGDRQ